MVDVIFPKRTLTPRELDTRPVAGDYRPKRMRLFATSGTESESYYGDEPGDEDYPEASLEISGEAGSHTREGELSRNRLQLGRNRLNEIATLMRSLTYGEMIELAEAIWKIRPEEGEVDEHNLPMMLHVWSTSSKQ